MKPKSAQTILSKWIDKQDILTELHISERTLQAWRSKQLIKYSRIGGKIYYNIDELEKLLQSNLH